VIKIIKFGRFNKMQSSQTRRSLGRTSLSLDLNLPSSLELTTQQTSSVPTLSEQMKRQTPPRQSAAFASPAVPKAEEEVEAEAEEEVEKKEEVEKEQTITSIPDLVRSKSLDEELVRSGYTPLTKMVVISPAGEPQVRFIKVKNQLGEPLYVNIDVNDAYVSQSNNDPRLRESYSSMNISEEEKELAFSKAGFGVSGVALECKSGLCTIMHDEQLNAPREKNYVLVHIRRVEETALVSASFPMIRMSDIRANPQACQKNIDQSFRKMRDAVLQKNIEKINCVQEKFNRTCQLFRQTLECKGNIIKEFQRTINLLEDYYNGCMKNPEKNIDKLKEIVYNLEKRNAKLPALIETCKEIALLEDPLDKAICILNDTKHKLEKKFRHINCVYELKDKKCQHYKCAWEKQDDESDVETGEK